MVDLYSYAMTCYKVLTGHIPFEGHPRYHYSGVLSGKKPKLLDYIDLSTQALLAQCWHPDPLKRPTFKSIQKQLEPDTNILKPETSVSERLEGLIAELLTKLEFEFNSH
jgi:serine/threonine protein kinase